EEAPGVVEADQKAVPGDLELGKRIDHVDHEHDERDARARPARERVFARCGGCRRRVHAGVTGQRGNAAEPEWHVKEAPRPPDAEAPPLAGGKFPLSGSRERAGVRVDARDSNARATRTFPLCRLRGSSPSPTRGEVPPLP